MPDKIKPCPFCGEDPKQQRNRAGGLFIFCDSMACELLAVDIEGESPAEDDTVVEAWNRRAPHPGFVAMREALKSAQALADAMETCHECKGTVLVAEQPVHCEDCSYDCDSHEGAECPTIYGLHADLKRKLALADKEL